MSGPTGELRLLGRLIEASNATFLGEDDDGARFVYKPVAGEAPLWDFPDHTLGRREVAAWRWSQAAGFGVVPETTWIEGPLGEGSAQRWVDDDGADLVDLVGPSALVDGWFPIVQGLDGDDQPVVLVHADQPGLRRLALFDVLANNADRKGGHIISHDSRVLGVDHGVCFHTEPKLRTIIWGWSGDGLTADEIVLVQDALASTDDALADLAVDERAAARARCEALLSAGRFPKPGDRWPVIPWPPL